MRFAVSRLPAVSQLANLAGVVRECSLSRIKQVFIPWIMSITIGLAEKNIYFIAILNVNLCRGLGTMDSLPMETKTKHRQIWSSALELLGSRCHCRNVRKTSTAIILRVVRRNAFKKRLRAALLHNKALQNAVERLIAANTHR